jgi:hypothetical protein
MFKFCKGLDNDVDGWILGASQEISNTMREFINNEEIGKTFWPMTE